MKKSVLLLLCLFLYYPHISLSQNQSPRAEWVSISIPEIIQFVLVHPEVRQALIEGLSGVSLSHPRLYPVTLSSESLGGFDPISEHEMRVGLLVTEQLPLGGSDYIIFQAIVEQRDGRYHLRRVGRHTAGKLSDLNSAAERQIVSIHVPPNAADIDPQLSVALVDPKFDRALRAVNRAYPGRPFLSKQVMKLLPHHQPLDEGGVATGVYFEIVLGTFEQERHRAGWDRHMRIGLRIALSEGGFTFEVKEARASKDTLFLGTSSLEEASQRIGHLAFSRSPVSNMRPFDVDAHMAEVAESFAGRFFSSLQVLRAYRVGTDERELRRVALHNVLGKMGWSEEAANCLQEESTFLAEISDVYLDARMRPVVAETFARVVKKSLR